MIVTLLTDFGYRDGYVAAMKGVILGRKPDATIVDIAHDVPPGDIRHAAHVLSTTAPFFPPRTIHVVVVDPGVGTDRREVGLMVADQVYLAPDNGVLTPILARGRPPMSAVHLNNPGFHRHPVCPTFHGRDIFAPAAANVAIRIPLTSLGSGIDAASLVRIPWPDPEEMDGGLQGEVMHLDQFGNAVTNIPGERVAALTGAVVTAAGQVIGPVHPTFGSVPTGEPVAYVGSSGALEVAIRDGSAARTLGLKPGSPVGIGPR